MSRNNAGKRPKLAMEGFVGRSRYFLSRALLNIRQNIFVNVITIGTITLAILIVALSLLIFVNLDRVTGQWSERVQVTAYFERELPTAELQTLRKKVAALPGTGKISYVSKNEALRKFQSRLRGQDAILYGVSADILPASLEIQLKKEYRSDGALIAYVSQLKKIEPITEVQYGEDWVRRFNNFLDFMRFVGILIGSFLLLAVVVIVANTIRLTIYARKDELELLSLVGATRMFIKAPFLIEGALQGAAGATLAIAILTGMYFGFLHNAGDFISMNLSETDLVFLPPEHLAAIFCSGVLLGFLGSITSLKRFISL